MNKKILLIEDDEVLASVYETKFNLEGYKVIIAKDGIEGMDFALHKKPDLILLDIVMPKLNGFELLKELKANPKTKEITVIILTNLGQEWEEKRGRELGASEYLVKANYTPAEVVKIVKKYLK